MAHPLRIDIETLPVGPLQANCYILTNPRTGSAIVVDPGAEPRRILSALGGRPVDRILLTHAHFDHIGALSPVREATQAPVYIHPAEAPWLEEPFLNGSAGPWAMGAPVRCAPPDGHLHHGDAIPFGDIQLAVAHTPGHSPGGLSFIGPGFALTGDALFRGSIGRTDLPGGDFGLLLQSIREHLLTLPDGTVLLPGHGPATTVADERETNPFLAT